VPLAFHQERLGLFDFAQMLHYPPRQLDLGLRDHDGAVRVRVGMAQHRLQRAKLAGEGLDAAVNPQALDAAILPELADHREQAEHIAPDALLVGEAAAGDYVPCLLFTGEVVQGFGHAL